MDPVTGWTGRTARALQAALRLSNEAFAERLGIGVRTVAAWHQKPSLRPRPEMQQVLDTALEQATPTIKARFAVLVGGSAPADIASPGSGPAAGAEQRLSTDPNIGSALDRLDQCAGWEPGTARRQVASRLARLDVRDLQDRAGRRRRVDQRRVAEALGDYYRGRTNGHGRYSARYGQDSEIVTSVLTHPEWLDLDCPLTAACDQLTLSSTVADADLSLDEQAAHAAAQRLAETLATGTRLVDMPLYRLLDIDVTKSAIAGLLGVTQFVRYALTMDLLEGELIDALTAGVSTRPGSLPLRDQYLPDIASVLGIASRLCAGGTLALCAIARSASPDRGPADYVLLIQERSGDVINAARRLAVIPKGFHQPMTDFRADARIGATLRREMEEELFGREDTDNTIGKPYAADPMHPMRLSEPMRWLMETPGRLRIECTGFGLNLVSGNFEFPALIVIDDEFCSRYGGQVEVNWESAALRQYSSLDNDSLAELVHDPAWSNEGLFALLQGLRRLKQIGENRVNMPAIEWQILS